MPKTDPPLPWLRRPKESEHAHAALMAYIGLGETRTLREAARVVGKSNALLSEWSVPWEWVERARAFDNHAPAVEQAAADQVRSRKAAEWEKRRLETCEAGFQIGIRLRERSMAMLGFPLSTTTTKEAKVSADGKTVENYITIKPGAWTFATAVSMARMAIELGMLSCDAALAEEDAFDPLSASEDECRAWIANQLRKRQALREAAKPEA